MRLIGPHSESISSCSYFVKKFFFSGWWGFHAVSTVSQVCKGCKTTRHQRSSKTAVCATLLFLSQALTSHTIVIRHTLSSLNFELSFLHYWCFSYPPRARISASLKKKYEQLEKSFSRCSYTSQFFFLESPFGSTRMQHAVV